MNFDVSLSISGTLRIHAVFPPSKCPFCHSSIYPKKLAHQVERLKSDTYLIHTIYQCPDPDCKRHFVTEARNDVTSRAIKEHRALTGSPVIEEWPESVKDLKSYCEEASNGGEQDEPSRFFKIYEQAVAAESQGFDELAGMGFRKAIEFLVKDLAISRVIRDSDDIVKQVSIIKKASLQNVIKTYFKDDLQGLMEKGGWLGNDESHYIRLFEEFSVEELKNVIKLITAQLEFDAQKQKFLSLERRK